MSARKSVKKSPEDRPNQAATDNGEEKWSPTLQKRLVTRLRVKEGGIRQTDPLHRATFALFGFNRTSDSDAIRMQRLGEIFNVRITCASEQEAPAGQKEEESPYHYQCDFKATLVGGLDVDAVVLMLDYFWLQGNWWAERYGENWIAADQCKVVEAFTRVPKLQVCWIPLDSSCGFMYKRCAEPEVVEKLHDEGLNLEFVDWQAAQEFHPLCIATAIVYEHDLTIEEKRSYFGQGRYVGAEVGSKTIADSALPTSLKAQKNDAKSPYSFAVVFREGLDWRSYMQSFRQDHDGAA